MIALQVSDCCHQQLCQLMMNELRAVNDDQIQNVFKVFIEKNLDISLGFH